ncbi:hypothetical protein C449_08689 [Halococcus saccharolyticus DSM 5350]|uniref:Uncharacterized protein n=1 Tax=Halococcus saccharolyticus DSM 5350 TaxID=1227455 RepID=M0MG87_9EURY|nr:hypothetical protein C449_08689 [Halococcus saccharolyticus DSM 5350]
MFAYDTFEVEATKADSSDPLSFDMAGRWQLTCRERAGGTVNERSIGYVTSRGAATETLLSCMEHASANARRSDSGEPLTLDTIAAGADRCDGTAPMRADRTRYGGGRRGRTH